VRQEPKSVRIDVAATFACLGVLLLWSLGPNFIKYLTAHVDLWTQNLLRYSVACLFWLPFLLAGMKKRHIGAEVWKRALLPGSASIIFQSLWAGAFYYINPAFMVLLTKSSVVLIAGFSLIFFRSERPLVKSMGFWLGLVLSVVGVIGVVYHKQDFAASTTFIGILIGLAAAVMWAAYTLSIRIAFQDVDSRSGFSVMSIYTVIGLAVLALKFGNLRQCTQMSAWPWVAVVFSGVTSIALSHVLYYAAIRRIGATVPAIVILAQPFTVLAISHFAFGESMSGLQILFGLILLAGSALAIWAQQHIRLVNGAAHTGDG